MNRILLVAVLMGFGPVTAFAQVQSGVQQLQSGVTPVSPGTGQPLGAAPPSIPTSSYIPVPSAQTGRAEAPAGVRAEPGTARAQANQTR